MYKLSTTKKKIIIVLIIVLILILIFILIYWFVIRKKTNYNDVSSTSTSTQHALTISNPRPIKGYYIMSWKKTPAPTGDWDFGVWFGGESPITAITNNIDKSGNITVGKKILDLGGGIDTGIWSNIDELKYVTDRLTDIKNAGWDGLCFDVEVCVNNVDFRDAFKTCFAACKTTGLMVIVTTSGIKPYECNTGEALMNSWIADTNIDYISPQLYGGDGTTLETQSLALFNNIQQKILPSIPYNSDWPKLNTGNIGITPGGYIIWNVQSSTPSTTNNYCGTSWDDANSKCATKCPSGNDGDCTNGQKCFGNITKCSSGGGGSTNYCGTSWDDANSKCATKCPSGNDGDCTNGQKCFGKLTECTPY